MESKSVDQVLDQARGDRATPADWAEATKIALFGHRSGASRPTPKEAQNLAEILAQRVRTGESHGLIVDYIQYGIDIGLVSSERFVGQLLAKGGLNPNKPHHFAAQLALISGFISKIVWNINWEEDRHHTDVVLARTKRRKKNTTVEKEESVVLSLSLALLDAIHHGILAISKSQDVTSVNFTKDMPLVQRDLLSLATSKSHVNIWILRNNMDASASVLSHVLVDRCAIGHLGSFDTDKWKEFFSRCNELYTKAAEVGVEGNLQHLWDAIQRAHHPPGMGWAVRRQIHALHPPTSALPSLQPAWLALHAQICSEISRQHKKTITLEGTYEQWEALRGSRLISWEAFMGAVVQTAMQAVPVKQQDHYGGVLDVEYPRHGNHRNYHHYHQQYYHNSAVRYLLVQLPLLFGYCLSKMDNSTKELEWVPKEEDNSLERALYMVSRFPQITGVAVGRASNGSKQRALILFRGLLEACEDEGIIRTSVAAHLLRQLPEVPLSPLIPPLVPLAHSTLLNESFISNKHIEELLDRLESSNASQRESAVDEVLNMMEEEGEGDASQRQIAVHILGMVHCLWRTQFHFTIQLINRLDSAYTRLHSGERIAGWIPLVFNVLSTPHNLHTLFICKVAPKLLQIAKLFCSLLGDQAQYKDEFTSCFIFFVGMFELYKREGGVQEATTCLHQLVHKEEDEKKKEKEKEEKYGFNEWVRIVGEGSHELCSSQLKTSPPAEALLQALCLSKSGSEVTERVSLVVNSHSPWEVVVAVPYFVHQVLVSLCLSPRVVQAGIHTIARIVPYSSLPLIFSLTAHLCTTSSLSSSSGYKTSLPGTKEVPLPLSVICALWTDMPLVMKSAVGLNLLYACQPFEYTHTQVNHITSQLRIYLSEYECVRDRGRGMPRVTSISSTFHRIFRDAMADRTSFIPKATFQHLVECAGDHWFTSLAIKEIELAATKSSVLGLRAAELGAAVIGMYGGSGASIELFSILSCMKDGYKMQCSSRTNQLLAYMAFLTATYRGVGLPSHSTPYDEEHAVASFFSVCTEQMEHSQMQRCGGLSLSVSFIVLATASRPLLRFAPISRLVKALRDSSTSKQQMDSNLLLAISKAMDNIRTEV